MAQASVIHGGGQTLVSGVKPAGPGPRLVAGDDRDGGGLQKSPTGDGFGRGEALRRAAARAQLMEQTAGAGVAGDDGYELGSGGRHSDISGNVAVVA